jgi:predicted Zn-dependent peptidase
MLVDSLFPIDAVENEKWVIIQEIRKAQDDNVKEAYYQ